MERSERPSKTRRWAVARLTTGAGAVALAGCGPERGPAAPNASPGAVTIRYAFFAIPAEAELWKRVAAEFGQQSPRVAIEPYHTNPDGEHFQRMAALLAAGGEPEVMMWTTRHLAAWAIKDTFYPLHDLVKRASRYRKDDIFPTEGNKNVVRGKALALPFTHAPQVIYYNKELFARSRLPEPPHRWDDPTWKWHHHLDTARRLARRPGPTRDTTVFGYDNGASWLSAQPFIWSNGGDYLSADHTRVQIDSPPVVEAFQWVAQFSLKHWVGPTDDDRKGTPGGTNGLFLAGKLAMFAATASIAPVLAAQGQVPWDVAPMPHQTAQAWTRNPQVNLAISRNNGGKKLDHAWLAIEHLAGEPGQTALAALHRGAPANKRVAASEAWLAPGASHDWKVFVDAAERHCHPEHEIVTVADVDRLIGQAYAELLAGRHSAAQMVAAIKPQLEALVREHTRLVGPNLCSSAAPVPGATPPAGECAGATPTATTPTDPGGGARP